LKPTFTNIFTWKATFFFLAPLRSTLGKLRATRERESAMSRLLMAFITRRARFHAVPGNITGCVESPADQRARNGVDSRQKRRLVERNWLLGRSGDRTNALLAASGFNLRQLLRYLKRMEIFLRFFLRVILTASTV
jgi:hypothetical protein